MISICLTSILIWARRIVYPLLATVIGVGIGDETSQLHARQERKLEDVSTSRRRESRDRAARKRRMSQKGNVDEDVRMH
ncbi:hypothetical protein C8R45DRAFT_1077767 [Mycena sanguinolenta]|nr:hypothetical protein C8R45DRAFT_1077767 [Mycena sanguinolenta]